LPQKDHTREIILEFKTNELVECRA